MKITITSNDGKKSVDVYTEDIDFAGHTMNRVVLDWRFTKAVNEVANYEANVAFEVECEEAPH